MNTGETKQTANEGKCMCKSTNKVKCKKYRNRKSYNFNFVRKCL